MAAKATGRRALLVEVVLSLAYPVGVHLLFRFEHERLAAAALFAFALVLLGRALVAARRAAQASTLRDLGVALVLAGLAVAAWFERSRALLLYPLVVSLGLFLAFALSLFRERTLIESLARLQDPNLGDAEVQHCRQATRVWSVFFLCNACAAGALSFFAPLWVWTLYTGFVSYVFAASIGVAELVIRVRRFGRKTAGPLGKWVLPVSDRMGLTREER